MTTAPAAPNISSPTISNYGDHAVLVNWETKGFSEAVNNAVHALAKQLRQSGKYTEVVPGYDSLVCVFDLAGRSMSLVKSHIEEILARQNFGEGASGQQVNIPVHYGGENGPDMDRICASA